MRAWKVCISFLFMWQNVYQGDIVSSEHYINYFSSEPHCDSFTNPSLEESLISDKVFSITSPNYPKNYPFNIDCITVIKSPNPNMVIKLEFIQLFHIEFSKNCTNDFLQINDGPYGFSKTKNRLCGSYRDIHTIVSTDRYLWLRFCADNTISESGFRLIYRFIEKDGNEKPKKYCYKKVTIPNGYSALLTDDYLTKHLQDSNILTNINECIFDIRVNKESNIFISLTHSNFTGIKTENQFIEIFDKVTVKSLPNTKKTYFYIDKNNTFRQRLLKYKRGIFRIFFLDIKTIIKFQFVVTAIQKPFEGYNCLEGQFKCNNAFCISQKLTCNNYMNCPYNEDESCWNGKILKEGETLNITSTIDPSYLKKINKLNFEKITTFKLHVQILGGIASVLLVLLLICVIHSIKQSKRNKPKVEGLITIPENLVSVNAGPNCDESPHYRRSSIVTLTTGQSTKKLYNISNPENTYVQKYIFQEYPLSNWDQARSNESFTPPLLPRHKQRRSSNVENQKKLNQFSTSKSVPKLFFDDTNPIPLLLNDNKIKIKKYYA